MTWASNIVMAILVGILIIKTMGLQERIKMFETAILSCVNEHPFIFKAIKEEDNVVVMCKRV
jgi:hypothetical protein